MYRQPELGPELARCQRYCSQVAVSAQAPSAGFAIVPWYAPVTMLRSPSLTVTAAGALINTAVSTDAVTDARSGYLQFSASAAGGSIVGRVYRLDAEI
jgi:hypothetical protein